jgi:hypothetical protein
MVYFLRVSFDLALQFFDASFLWRAPRTGEGGLRRPLIVPPPAPEDVDVNLAAPRHLAYRIADFQTI